MSSVINAVRSTFPSFSGAALLGGCARLLPAVDGLSNEGVYLKLNFVVYPSAPFDLSWSSILYNALRANYGRCQVGT